MNCQEYLSLLPKEQVLMIGKIVHCLQNDSNLFLSCQALIELGERKGVFEDVVIAPEINTNPSA